MICNMMTSTTALPRTSNQQQASRLKFLWSININSNVGKKGSVKTSIYQFFCFTWLTDVHHFELPCPISRSYRLSKKRACLSCDTGHHTRKHLSQFQRRCLARRWQRTTGSTSVQLNSIHLLAAEFKPQPFQSWSSAEGKGESELVQKWHSRVWCVGCIFSEGRWWEEGVYIPSSDGAELNQSPDRVLVEWILAGWVVEAGLHGVAVTHGAAAGKHTRRRGHLLWGKKVVVSHRLLEAVAVVVCVAVSMDRQHVSGLVATETRGGCWRGGLAEGEWGARASQGEGGAAG